MYRNMQIISLAMLETKMQSQVEMVKKLYRTT